MTDYDIFAPFYDAVMGDRSDVVELVESLIATHQPQAQAVLELGCGTGGILAGLADRYQVAGIDQSANMLAVASQKLPMTQLHKGNIAGFELDQTYDVIICLFDTINHLTNFADWQRLFNSVAAHLNPGGLFIFDMNTIGRLQVLTASTGYTQEFDGRTMDMTITPTGPHEVEWHVVIQDPRPDGVIEVHEEYVREASFVLKHVRAELDQSFTVITVFDTDQADPTDNSSRIYFVARPLQTRKE